MQLIFNNLVACVELRGFTVSENYCFVEFDTLIKIELFIRLYAISYYCI